MSLTTVTPTRRRDVQVSAFGSNTTIFRSRTWDRLKFEVEYARQKGTTANSYLIEGDKTALIDPPGESFSEIFLHELREYVSLHRLDYIILSHVNPNRMTTLKRLLENSLHLQVICSKPAANVLKAAFPQWENQIQGVRSEDTLDLGQDHLLQFTFAPTPRWADGLCTYDPKTRILYTDKLFGVHLCGDAVFDEDWKQLDSDRRYYFECLHAGQSRQVEAILDKLALLPAKYYAPGHGPVVRYSLSRLTYDYRQWCQTQNTQGLKVALLYASAYGNTAILADAIAQGLLENDVAVELVNCEAADPAEITEIVKECDGFIMGSPTLGGHAPVQIQTALGIVMSNVAKTKPAGVFGSYGWSGEAIDLLEGKLKDANYRLGFEPIRVRFSPTDATLEQCQAAGAEFAQGLKKQKKQRVPRQALTEAQVDRTEQAVGRIIGSLSVLTLKGGETHQAFLTSLISQATFSPPGLMISVGKDQNADVLRTVGTPFVLNVLKEGRSVRKHFSYQIMSQENFSQVPCELGSNGCLILTDALAYLECTVQECLEAGDRWLVYAIVNKGDVLEATGVTAIAHRKSGSHY